MSDISEAERQFIVLLEKATRETGIIVTGCGCCGSPSLDKTEHLSEEAGYSFAHPEGECDLCWVYPDEYEWDQNDARPIRPHKL